MEKDRAATEKRLLDAVGQIIDNEGLEGLGVNAVAKRAGVAKMLIYRYFGSLDKLIGQYIMQQDFWINPPAILPGEDIRQFAHRLFKQQVEILREDSLLVKLFRWELSADNEIAAAIRHRREENGLALVEYASSVSGMPYDTVRFLATMISSSVTYLAMFSHSGRVYNGYDLYTDGGWEELERGIESLVDKYML